MHCCCCCWWCHCCCCCCYVVIDGGGVSNGVGSDGGLVVFITTWRSRLERGGHFEREE